MVADGCNVAEETCSSFVHMSYARNETEETPLADPAPSRSIVLALLLVCLWCFSFPQHIIVQSAA